MRLLPRFLSTATLALGRLVVGPLLGLVARVCRRRRLSADGIMLLELMSKNGLGLLSRLHALI